MWQRLSAVIREWLILIIGAFLIVPFLYVGVLQVEGAPNPEIYEGTVGLESSQ